MEKLSARVDALHVEMAEHDQSDFPGLAEFAAKVKVLEDQVSEHEHRWIELSELVDG
jgi:hypothetical protein